jgi:hypothetical protein
LQVTAYDISQQQRQTGLRTCNMQSLLVYLSDLGITSPSILCSTVLAWAYVLYVHHYDYWQSALSQFQELTQHTYWLVPLTYITLCFRHNHEKYGCHCAADVLFAISITLRLVIRCCEIPALALGWHTLFEISMPLYPSGE